FVVEHIFEKYLFGRKFLFEFFVVSFRIIVLILLNVWQTTRLRGITDQQICNKGNHNRYQCREIQFALPITKYCYTHNGKGTNQSTTNIVCYIPNRHLCASLLCGEPVYHNSPRRWPTHSLEPTVYKHQSKHDGNRRG